MALYTFLLALFAIAGSVSAYPLNPRKTVRLGNAAVAAHATKAPDDWDPEVPKKVSYKHKSDGLAPQIVNGDLVKNPADYPSVVSMITIDKSDNTFEQWCTGSLIDKNLVLTSALCVKDLDTDNYYWAVCGGLVDLQDLTELGDNCGELNTVWWPTAFDPDNYNLGHDLGVIKLSSSLTVDPIKPIKISLTKPVPGTEVVAPGFGDTYKGQDQVQGQLRKHEGSIVLNEGECSLLNDNPGYGGNPWFICADGSSDGLPSTACNGDGGGPLIVLGDTTDDQYTVGVLSLLEEKCDPESESVYASLYYDDHIAFLKGVLDEAGGSIEEVNPTFSPAPTQSVDSPPPPSADEGDSTPSPPQPTSPPFQGGGAAGACFPAEATVIVDVGGERTSRAMRDLQIGDRVQTGKDSFSEVFAFTHRTEKVHSDFVRVVAGDATVEMSPTHYIPVYGRGLVAAAHLRVGDVLQLGSGKGAMVQSTSVVTRRGLYNPQTMDDAIVVDGVVASTFTQTVHPQVARWLLMVPKSAYRLGVVEPLGRWFYATAPRLVLRLVPQGSPVLAGL